MSILTSTSNIPARKVRNELYFETLGAGKSIHIYIRGFSMYPYIKNYDLLTIEPIKDRLPELGEVVLVSQQADSGTSFIIHRLVKKVMLNGQFSYFTRGDQLVCRLEGPFEPSRIKGRVVCISRGKLKFVVANRRLAKLAVFLSLRAPYFLVFINKLNSLILERALFLSKLIKFYKCSDILYFNSQELLIKLLSSEFNESGAREAVALIAEGVRWNSFLTLAGASGRYMTILKSLNQLQDFIDIPGFVIERLQESRLKVLAESTRCHQQLLRLGEAFFNQGIAAIALKGTNLSQRLYKDIAARGMSVDIDLLIKEQDLSAALDVMHSLGYQKSAQEEIEAWRWHEEFSKSGFFMVDLHWDITMMVRSSERIRGFWAEAKKEPGQEAFLEASFCQLSDEALLMYLCAHLVNSQGYRNLKSLCDIIALLKNLPPDFNWSSLVKKARAYRLNNSVYACLALAQDIFAQKIPLPVLFSLKPSLLKRLYIKLFLNRSVIFTDCLRRKLLDNFLSYILFESLEARSLAGYFKIAVRVLLPPKAALEKSQHLAATYPAPHPGAHLSALLRRLFYGFHKIASLFFK